MTEDNSVDSRWPLNCLLFPLGFFESGREITVFGKVKTLGHVEFLVGLPHPIKLLKMKMIESVSVHSK